MNKSRKTSHILNVFQYDETTGAVTLPSTLSLTAPSAGDNSSKVATTAWARTFVASLSYLTSGTTTTSDIGEGTNLYYTQSRFNTAFGLKTTTNLTEGTNLYYTDSRVGTYLTSNGYATQSYVGTQLANLVAAAPATLDTLNELAAALGNDPSFATTVTTSIGTKVPQARTLTINGTTYDLSTNRSWTITSMIYPGAGIAVSTGTAWGTSITDNSTNWNTAYGWGNHASGGYLTSATAATTYASLTGAYANPAFVASLAYSKITGVPAFLTSYTETDPYRVTAVAISGTSTKTITITRADASTVTTTWTDIDTDTNTYVTSAAFSGGTLTLTRNDAGTVSVSLDGRYYLASNPSGYITGITSSMVTTALGYTPYNSTNPNGYITGITSSNVITALGYTPYNSTNPNGYISSYTETSTLANVTARGSSTTAGITVNGDMNATGIVYSRANQTTAYTSAALWTQSFGSTLTGIAFHVSGVVGRMLHMNASTTDANLYWNGTALVYNSGTWGINITGSAGSVAWTNVTSRPTALSQFTNDLGNYGGWITSYTETSTLANVTARGATTTAAITTGVLTVNTGGTGTWGPFVVTSTSQWGDGATQYVTIGAGGAAGIMINNPHIVWNAGEAAAVMKFGRSGGTSSGSYYNIGTGASNNFFINKDGAIASPILNINSSGNATFSGTLSASNLSGTNTGDQTNISGNAATAGGLAVHSGRNNEANKIVRTDGNGYIQAGYINSTSGNENNNSNADRVWGTNGSDDYLRTYRTSALSVGYAASAGAANGSSFFTQANATWGARMQLGGNGDPGAVATTAVVQATDGNLHMDCGTGKSMYLNYYRNGIIYLNGGTYSISANGSYYNGTASYANNSGALNGWGYTSYAYRASGSGYYQISDWIQVNTNTGLYWPNHYGLHFYPNNDGSYGSAQILGDKGGWRGLHFGGGTGITLMMNEGEFGFHRQAVGWVARFTSGRFYGASDNVYNLDYALGNTHYWTAINYFQTNNGGQAVNNSNSAKLQAYSTGNNSAFMSFHKGSYYAVNFGLDDDNVMRIGGWSAGANRWQLDMSGNMTVAGDVTAYSDARVKENIITVDNALTKVLSLRGVYYNRIDSDDKKTKIGVIAQETLLVVPEVVNQDNDGMFNVSYGNLAGLFIEAIKEQQKEIEELKTIIYGLTR